jgi:hypothetical protein
MIEIAWARRKSDGRIVGVDQVPNGLACECVCTLCDYPLVAAQGDVLRHHFRHHADGSTCNGGQETALHILAKDIVMRATSIKMPEGNVREILSTELEPTMGDVRPDVLITTPQGPVAIEMAVNHWTGEAKIARLANMNLPAVEIDISIYRGVLMTAEELTEVILSTAARRWLRVRKEREKPPSPRKPKNWIPHYRDESGAPVDWAVIDAQVLKPEPAAASVEVPAPPTAFMHYCHCGRWGAFGYGVDLLNGKLGRWYCAEHRRELLAKIVVP